MSHDVWDCVLQFNFSVSAAKDHFTQRASNIFLKVDSSGSQHIFSSPHYLSTSLDQTVRLLKFHFQSNFS